MGIDYTSIIAYTAIGGGLYYWYTITRADLLSATYIEDETGTRFLDDDIANQLCNGTLTRKSFLEILKAWKVLPDRSLVANIITDADFLKLAELARPSCENSS